MPQLPQRTRAPTGAATSERHLGHLEPTWVFPESLRKAVIPASSCDVNRLKPETTTLLTVLSRF